MATNLYIGQGVRSEQELYENLVIEALQIYGQDVYYIPRDIVNEDPILLDDVPSRFNSAYKIEMYIQNTEGFEGEGDLFTKFGVEIRDQATFIVSRRRWNDAVKRYDNEITAVRPVEGDLIYLPLSNSIFQIMKVEHQIPFYQLNKLPTYQMVCELFEYNDEDFDTGIPTLDDVEQEGYRLQLQLTDSSTTPYIVGNTVFQTLGAVTVSADVVEYDGLNNNLTIAHIAADSSGFHTFATGAISSYTQPANDGNIFQRNVVSINELLNNPSAQNETFDDNNIIDFEESNPFGEPIN